MMKVAVETEQTGCSYIECDANMPPIGTRIRRGPDWRWDNQDLEMPGTVVSHTKTGKVLFFFGIVVCHLFEVIIFFVWPRQL